tara:strand:+ start:1886 stop:2182 length:297 start_codon:yes stop_codon:yes gene_type:complete
MLLSWDYFVRRRSINIDDFVSVNKITTYEQFCSFLHDRCGVEPPPRENVLQHFPKKREKPAQAKTRLGRSSASRKKVQEKAKNTTQTTKAEKKIEPKS